MAIRRYLHKLKHGQAVERQTPDIQTDRQTEFINHFYPFMLEVIKGEKLSLHQILS